MTAAGDAWSSGRLTDRLAGHLTAVMHPLGVRLADGAASLGLLARRRRPAAPSERRVVMVLSTAYSLHVLRARGAEHTLTHRDLDGYFDRVWSVHPLVGASPDDLSEASIGKPSITPLAPRHTMVEGTVGLSRHLCRLPLLNFLLAQARLMRLLSRLVADEEVDIIRAWDPFYTGLMALVLGRLHGVPVEVRINANHDAIYEAVGDLAFPRLIRWRWLERAVGRFTLSRAQQVVVLSANNRDYALKNGAPIERIVCSGNWSMIDPVHLVAPTERAQLDSGFGLEHEPFVVAVSRLERVKHPEDVVRALAEARVACPALKGLLIGEGAMRAELEELSRELGLDGSLFFAGDRDQRWISQALASAAVVLAPLAGLALVEAALSATPIVAYDVEWHPEFIVPGESGILVPYRDTKAMAAAACAIVTDPQRAARLGTTARSQAIARMQPDRILSQERAWADRLIAGGHGA